MAWSDLDRPWSLVRWPLERVGLLSPPLATVLLLGLDNTGKTTLVSFLRDGQAGRLPHPAPTGATQPHYDQFSMGRVRYRAVDFGGMASNRRLWREYYGMADAVIFVVDAADPWRLAEAKEALQKILRSPEAAKAPVLCLGNKIDRPGAVTLEELAESLELPRRALARHIDQRVPRRKQSWGDWLQGSSRSPVRFALDEAAAHDNQLLAALCVIPILLESIHAVDVMNVLARTSRNAHSMVQPAISRIKQLEAEQEDYPERPIALYMCSLLKMHGLKQAFEWLQDHID